jgi:hypothetical protein
LTNLSQVISKAEKTIVDTAEIKNQYTNFTSMKNANVRLMSANSFSFFYNIKLKQLKLLRIVLEDILPKDDKYFERMQNLNFYIGKGEVLEYLKNLLLRLQSLYRDNQSQNIHNIHNIHNISDLEISDKIDNTDNTYYTDNTDTINNIDNFKWLLINNSVNSKDLHTDIKYKKRAKELFDDLFKRNSIQTKSWKYLLDNNGNEILYSNITTSKSNTLLSLLQYINTEKERGNQVLSAVFKQYKLSQIPKIPVEQKYYSYEHMERAIWSIFDELYFELCRDKGFDVTYRERRGKSMQGDRVNHKLNTLGSLAREFQIAYLPIPHHKQQELHYRFLSFLEEYPPGSLYSLHPEALIKKNNKQETMKSLYGIVHRKIPELDAVDLLRPLHYAITYFLLELPGIEDTKRVFTTIWKKLLPYIESRFFDNPDYSQVNALEYFPGSYKLKKYNY